MRKPKHIPPKYPWSSLGKQHLEPPFRVTRLVVWGWTASAHAFRVANTPLHANSASSNSASFQTIYACPTVSRWTLPTTTSHLLRTPLRRLGCRCPSRRDQLCLPRRGQVQGPLRSEGGKQTASLCTLVHTRTPAEAPHVDGSVLNTTCISLLQPR